MSKKQRPPGDLVSVATGWHEMLLVCRKCSRKLDGGFGERGEETLRKALRGLLRTTGKRGETGLVEVACFGICPKRAVIMATSGNPSELVVVPVGTSLSNLRSRLKL